MKKETDAYITLYLSLILGVLLTAAFIILEGIRENTIRTEIESVTDLSLYSIFAEYNRELLNQYELFAIDTSYGEGAGSINNTKEHMQYYMNENFTKERAFGIFSYRDLTALHCDNVNIKEYCLLSDDKGDVIKEQIISYMKYKNGIILADKFFENYNILTESMENSKGIEEEWEKADLEIQEIMQERNESWTEEEPPPALENPADYVKAVKDEGILSIVLPADKNISVMMIDPSHYYSRRNHKKGTGKIKKHTSVVDQVMEKGYIMEYLFEKCGNFLNKKEGSLLQYQIEYLICENQGDLENLEEIAEKIRVIRQGINLAYLLTDQQKMSEADTVAILVSTACFLPEIKDVVKAAILFAWSYVESLQDVRILFDGKKVPLIKSDETWNMPLSHIMDFTSVLSEYKSSEEGMNYEEYLEFFLYIKKEEKLFERFMDLCEMDIRMTKGNENFRVDDCITQLKAEASCTSGFGSGYSITRSFYYE